MDIENFFPARNLEILRKTGLHKVAAVMNGLDEITIKEAVAILGAKAYLHRKEMQKVAAGIQALAEITGEKIAGLPIQQMLTSAVGPALLGGTAAVLPRLIMDPQPSDSEDLLKRFGIGAALGGVGGGLWNAHRALNATGQGPALGEAIKRLP